MRFDKLLLYFALCVFCGLSITYLPINIQGSFGVFVGVFISCIWFELLKFENNL